MSESTAKTPAKRENLLLNIAFNIVVPSVILSYLSKDHLLGPVYGLILALVFPVGYGIYDFITRKKANFISILGFASILMTGGLGLMQVDAFWFAVKEASVPLVIGAMILISQRSKNPLVREFLYNDQVINVDKVDAALEERGNKPAFEALLARSSYLLAGGFLLSAVMNFGLARYILKSAPATPEFNAELGKLNLLSWPIIVLPCMAITMYALWKLLKGVEALSGLAFDDLMHAQPATDEKKPEEAKVADSNDTKA